MDKIYPAGPWITDYEIKVLEDAIRNACYENAMTMAKSPAQSYYLQGREYGAMSPNRNNAIHLLPSKFGYFER